MSQLNSGSTKHPSPLLGVPVDCGYDSSSGWSDSLLLGFLSQVLTDVGGGVGAFQFRLLPLSFTTGIRLGWLSWFLLGCRWCGRWGLGNGNFRGVKVDTIGRGMVVAVGPRHSVKKLAKRKERRKKKAEIQHWREMQDVKLFSIWTDSSESNPHIRIPSSNHLEDQGHSYPSPHSVLSSRAPSVKYTQ